MENAKILIVDDDVDLAKAMQITLESRQYTVITAENKTAALPRLGQVIELVVSHCDPTVNQFECYFVTRDDKVVDQWPIDMRGRSQ